MNANGLSRDLALRIGVAARALPGGDVARMMEALVDALGLPLTEKRLDALTVGRLRAAAGGALAAMPRAALRRALGYLRGTLPIVVLPDSPPALEDYEAGDMPGSVRVAVASQHAETISGSFSGCDAFFIYQVSPLELRLIDWRLPPPVAGREARDAQRAALIDDCHLLYVQAIGNPATARLMVDGVHPVRCPEGGAARDRLAQLQAILRDNPPPWLARAMGEDFVLPRRVGFSGPLLVHPREAAAEAG